MTDSLHLINVQAPAANVYKALSTLDGLKGWWTVDTKADTKPGGKATFGFYNRAVVFGMTFDAMTPGKLVSLTCADGPPGWAGTKLSFELEDDAQQGGTRVRFRHGDFAAMDDGYAQVNTTWGQLLGTLKAYVESGAAKPLFAF